ncbi:OmpA family protein [Flammeovirga sp. SubArs3]|nr:OmpA family protein [Flammeovirga sp. SubArs3]
MRFSHCYYRRALLLCVALLSSFALTEASNKEFTLKGIYVDSDNGNTIEGVKVCIQNIKSGAKTTIYTDQNGQFVITLEGEAEFKVYGTKPLYFDQEEHNLTTIGLTDEEIIEMSFAIEEVHFNTLYTLTNLEFEINSHFNVINGEEQITFLSDLLRTNPDVKVTIRVHSDSRGADIYNKEMTQKRADYLREVLMSKKVAASKIDAEGIGEEELLNDCGNGIKCSAGKHLENRRIEFILSKG